MSLLGNNVYANPNTPIWGQGGGGGGGSNFQLLNITQTGGTPGELNFYKNVSGTSFAQLQMYPNPGVVGTQVLSVFDASGLADTVQVGDLQAAGTGTLPGAEPPALSLGMAGTGTLGLRLVNTDVGGVIATYATVGSGGWDLSNVQTINGSNYPPGGGGSYPRDTSFNSITVNPSSTAPVAMELGAIGSNIGLYGLDEDGNPGAEFISFSASQMDLSNVTSINGVPYFNSPGTQFDFRSYPGGVPLVEAPDWGVLNAISFTPPVDGKVYVESLGTYVALVTGGGVSMTFAVDGTNISETPTTFNAYAGNTNLFGTSMFQFAVSANVTYDISSIAHCSAIPPADPDVVVTSSRMFLLFSPN
jgi:hypothetical protein